MCKGGDVDNYNHDFKEEKEKRKKPNDFREEKGKKKKTKNVSDWYSLCFKIKPWFLFQCGIKKSDRL